MFQIVFCKIPHQNKTTKLVIIKFRKKKIRDLEIIDQMYLLKLILKIIFLDQLNQDLNSKT
jgi:hypothetical protein